MCLLQLCLPCPDWVSPEYGSLFPSEAPDSSTKDGKLALLSRFKQQLTEWGNLLRRFLKSEDDQVGTGERAPEAAGAADRRLSCAVCGLSGSCEASSRLSWCTLVAHALGLQ